ncbi:MAG: EF-hand domain-containing protein [Pricia sp.]
MKAKTFKTIIATAVFALFFTGLSYAQSPQNGNKNQEPPSVDEIFEKMDKDEDGKLSEKEVKGPLKKDFSKIDADEDGFLSKEEVEKAPKPQRKGGQRGN